jgi:hypothetical protein
MRKPTRQYLAQLPARKRLKLLFLLMVCGGLVASGGALA